MLECASGFKWEMTPIYYTLLRVIVVWNWKYRLWWLHFRNLTLFGNNLECEILNAKLMICFWI